MRSEVLQPTRTAPRRAGGKGRGRLLWRSEGGSRLPRRPHPDAGGSPELLGPTTRRVLVIDDESSIRMLCRVNLSASGMDVLEAADGPEGIELARREQPDLILLDVMMPGVDGWRVARELAKDERTREIPVVFLTARAESSDRRRGQLLGGVGYIVKPFDPVGIGELVESVLTRLARGEHDALRREITSEGDEAPR